jgi:molecular chaperone GrpE
MSKKQEKAVEESAAEENDAIMNGEQEADALPVMEEAVDDTSSFVKELEQQKEKFVRLLAEFENYKRRTAKERMDIIRTAGQDIVGDLLPALDDIDRAESVIEKAQDLEAVRSGLKLISEKIRNVVTQKGLKAMEVMGEDFDSETMEAITEIEVDAKQKGKVVDVVEKGYTLNDKIIRYAKVVVGK